MSVADRLEALHLSLTSPRRLVRYLRSVVRVLGRVVNDRRHDGPVRRRVALQLVGDQSVRPTALALQQLAEELLGSAPVAPRLNENVDEIAILVDGTPPVLSLATDGDKNLVEVPGIAKPSAPALELRSVARTELRAPLADRFVGDPDSALGQQIFDITEA